MDPVTIGAAGAASSAFGAWMNNKAQKKTNEMNQAIAREQMAFQERMSNTAHQRETDDLRAAGLNRILGATKGGGASAPSGSSSTAIAPRTGDIISSSVSSALSAENLRADLDTKDANVAKTMADTLNTVAQTRNTELSGEAIPFENVRKKHESYEAYEKRLKSSADAQTAHIGTQRAGVQANVEKAEGSLAIKQAGIDEANIKLDNILKRTGQVIDQSAKAISTRRLPVSIKPGTRAEKSALERAGRKGVPVK